MCLVYAKFLCDLRRLSTSQPSEQTWNLSRRLAPPSRPFTVFYLLDDKFQYKRQPMSISTAPDEYQACMEQIFNDLKSTVVDLDNMLVVSTTPDELEHSGPHSCDWLARMWHWMGNMSVFTTGDELLSIYSVLGRHQTSRIKQVIQKIAIQQNRKELRRFLGIMSYYRDIMSNKMSLCKSLPRFTSNKIPFTWLPSKMAVFKAIQVAFTEALLMTFPDFDTPFDVTQTLEAHSLEEKVRRKPKFSLLTPEDLLSVTTTR